MRQKMKISTYQTALLLVLMFNRSGFKRARLTTKTISRISGRTMLRSQFIMQLQAELDDLDMILFETGRGFGLIRCSLLDGAMVLSEQRWVSEELADIAHDVDYDFGDIKEELGLNDGLLTVDIDDDFNFEDDEPVIEQKPSKKKAKKQKLKNSVRRARIALNKADSVDIDDEEFDFD